MAKKYIKGKDGKFKGSLPELQKPAKVQGTIPQLPSVAKNSVAESSIAGGLYNRRIAKPEAPVKLEEKEIDALVEGYLVLQYWDGPSDNDPNDEIFDADSPERQEARAIILEKLSSVDSISSGMFSDLLSQSNNNREAAIGLLVHKIYNQK
jgi:hypothetical protein